MEALPKDLEGGVGALPKDLEGGVEASSKDLEGGVEAPHGERDSIYLSLSQCSVCPTLAFLRLARKS